VSVKIWVFNQAPRHEHVLIWKNSATHPLTLALDGGEWSASRSGRFTPEERAYVTNWIGGWLNQEKKIRSPPPYKTINPSFSPV